MPPENIDRYEVKELLGKGGMATVYHAYDPRFKRDVAIKVLPREFMHDPTFRARFDREAQTIAALEHSFIVPVYDFGEHDGQPFLVMRYMAGGSLAELILEGPLSIEDSAIIIDRIASALDSAHNDGIIHRDIKPGNILFDRHNDAYLGDFGIVRLSEATMQLTGSGIVGTPAYMAPEMADEGGLSPLVDIYALGVTLFEMLTGEQPYRADTPIGVLMAHMNRPVPDPREYRHDLPPDTLPIIQRAMAKDPMHRYQLVSDLAADLNALQRGETITEHIAYKDTVPFEEEEADYQATVQDQSLEDEMYLTEEMEAITDPLATLPTNQPIAPPPPETVEYQEQLGGGYLGRPEVSEVEDRPEPRGKNELLFRLSFVGVIAVLCLVGILLGALYFTAPSSPSGWVVTYNDTLVSYHNVPTSLQDKLLEINESGYSIRQMTAGTGGGWLILYGTNSFSYNNISQSLIDKMDELHGQGYQIKDVAITTTGGWLILYDTNSFSYNNVSQTLIDKMNEIHDDGHQIHGVTLTTTGGWLIRYGANGFAYHKVSQSLIDKMNDLNSKGYDIKDVEITATGGWLVLYQTNSFSYEKIPTSAVEKLDELNADNRNIQNITFISSTSLGGN